MNLILISFPKIITLSCLKSILVLAFFIASLLRSNGISYFTTSVVMVAGTPAIITGNFTNLRLLIILLSPNLNMFLLSETTTFKYSSLHSESKKY